MITNARVLQEDFVPDDIIHRYMEAQRLSEALKPLLEGRSGETAHLYGPTGVGKTCVTRFVLRELDEETLSVRHQYVNCWRDHTRFRALYRILDGVDRTLDIHRRSTPHDELLSRLEEADDSPYVVVLDEVDQLEDKSVLYDLHSIGHVTLVLISNEQEEVFANADNRVVSRLSGGATIRFDRYSTTELVEILERRVEAGLATDVIDRAQLERLADDVGGDARVGITTLRTAAERASSSGLNQITDDVLDTALDDAEVTIREKTLDQLTEHQQVLYEILDDRDQLSPGELYEEYRAAVDDPRTKRMMRNYLSKLEHYNLIKAKGEKRGRIYTTA